MTPLEAIDIARKLIGLAMDLIPADEARKVIDEEAVRRANAVADLAEDAVIAAQKFGGDLK